MTKYITALALIVCAICVAQTHNGTAYTVVSETVGTTQYVGSARTTEYSTATPSTNAAVWAIVRIVEDSSGNLLEVKNAYGDGEGINSLYSTAWTNRVNATYK